MHSTPSHPRVDGPLARRHRARLHGQGARCVVLSHGLGTDQTAWSEVLPSLARRFTVLTYDLPGAGPLLPDEFDVRDYLHLSAYADDLLALLHEVGVQHCCYVGHSVSGMIGALAAVADPARFQRMVLLNASPRYLNDVGYVGGFEQPALDGLFETMRTQYEAWVAGFAPAAIGADMPEAVQRFADSFLQMRPDITVGIARAIFESDLRDILPLVSPPVVLVHTRDDIAVPPEVAHYLHAQLPDSELVWIDAVGHLPHLSAPEEVVAALERAL